MKTKKELQTLSANIGKAIRKYHNAIAANLKESGKEHDVLGNEDEDDTKGLHLTIIGRHDDAIDICVDKVRYNEKADNVEAHIVEEGFKKADYWLDISYFGDDEDYVNDSIVWED